MQARTRHRPSPALVVASLALASSLAGTSYAAVVLPAGSVGTRQLKNGAVVEAKVKDHSLLARDFARGQLPAGRPGVQGPQGLSGPAGVQGPAGPKGDPATRLFAVVSEAGGIVRSSGGVSVSKTGAGSFTVSFPQDVSNCAVASSIAAEGGALEAGFVASTPQGASVQDVAVQTFDSGGDTDDRPFSVAVFC